MTECENVISDAEKLKHLAQKMREAEYKGLSEEEIKERELQKEAKRKNNILILEDTLHILKKGSYIKENREIKLPFSLEEMKEIQVFLPKDIDMLRAKADITTEIDEKQIQSIHRLFSCENSDALIISQKKYEELKENGDINPRVLVLNLASATEPGGHTRKGAAAQEEDLCRKTSLLLSLECESAKKYYNYNNEKKTRMGSDAVMLSPNVAVIKDSSKTLAEPFPISVISCAAPMVRLGLEGKSQEEYEAMLCKRIQGILLVAASQNYRNIILGAFGCGVYGNDAAVVSDLFYRTILNFTYKGKRADLLFKSIDFAVLCNPNKDYNYREFCRNFSTSK